MNGLNFSFSSQFGQLPNKPGSSQTSSANSRQEDLSGLKTI
jgi:hypothetical protein